MWDWLVWEIIRRVKECMLGGLCVWEFDITLVPMYLYIYSIVQFSSVDSFQFPPINLVLISFLFSQCMRECRELRNAWENESVYERMNAGKSNQCMREWMQGIIMHENEFRKLYWIKAWENECRRKLINHMHWRMEFRKMNQCMGEWMQEMNQCMR